MIEIIYVWMEEGIHDNFDQLDINLSPLHEFSMSKKEKMYILKESKDWPKRESVFRSDEMKNGGIVNIGAIVGKNGVGKTTLIKAIIDACTGKLDKGYLIVFKENDVLTYCSDNLGKMNLQMEDGLMMEKKSFPSDMNIIYFSNASIGNILSSRNEENVTISTPDTVKTYLEKRISHLEMKPETYADLSFIRKVHINKDIAYNGKRSNTIKVEFNGRNSDNYTSISTFMEVVQEDSGNQASNRNKIFNLLLDRKKYSKWNKIGLLTRTLLCSTFDMLSPNEVFDIESDGSITQTIYTPQVDRLTEDCIEAILEINLEDSILSNGQANQFWRNIYLSVITESVPPFFTNVHTPEEEKEANDNLKEYLKILKGSIREGTLDWGIIRKLVSFNNEKKALYTKLIDEFCELRDYFLKYEIDNNTYVIKEDDKDYDKILRLLLKGSGGDECICKYIEVNLPNISTGERAIQNIFSWINLLVKDSSEEAEDENKQLLLIIDEADVYLHPDWQRNFVRLLIESVNYYLKGKYVQVLFSTHSPLCLSDIPKENIVFVKKEKKDERLVVEICNRGTRKQTFGCDLYSILADSFYLESMGIGSYAEKYIDEIIDYINSKGMIPPGEWDKLQKKIEYIGNPIIRNKLLQMIGWSSDTNMTKYINYIQNRINDMKNNPTRKQ